jgi:hypothetical protein
VVETALVVDVTTKYNCNCTKDCIFKDWTLNCGLEEFLVSILTFIWQERIYCSACYPFEWNPDGVQLFKWVRSYEKVPFMKMMKIWALANLSKLSGE